MNTKLTSRPKQVRMNVDPEMETMIVEASTATRQTETWVATVVMRAGLEALRSNKYTVKIPLQFVVASKEGK